jgi:hypothetical protein
MTNQPRGIQDVLGGPQRTLIILVLVILVSGMGIGGLAFALFGRHGSSAAPAATAGQRTSSPAGSAGTETVTETTMAAPPPCSDPPQVGVTSVNLTAKGLTMEAEFSTSCDDGDTLTGSAVVMSAAQGTRDFGSGIFDLDADPIVIPPGSKVDRTLVYPAGTYWRIPELVRNGPMDVQISDVNQSGDTTSASDGSSTLTAIRVADPGHGSLEGTATHALTELADYDRGAVKASLENFWVPQISSKKVGLYADGITYTNNDILRNHLNLRERYPNTRLVWANDWTTFSTPDWWVTVVGQPYYDGPSANQWCDAHGIDADNCFAKVISSRFGPEGTTMMRN